MSDLQELRAFRERRLLWPRNDGTAQVFIIPDSGGSAGMHMKKILKDWIASHTSGEFYLGHNTLCFYSEKDAVAFKIADCVKKAQVEYRLRKEINK